MPKLLDNWKAILKRSWSVRANAIGAAVAGVFLAWPDVLTDIWNIMPDAARAVLPENVAMVIPVALPLVGILARILAQPDGE